MPLLIPSSHAHLANRVRESTITVEVTVQHLDDDVPAPADVASAIRDGLDGKFFSAPWPAHAWSIERLQGGAHE